MVTNCTCMSLFENILLTVISISFKPPETTITFRFVLLIHVHMYSNFKLSKFKLDGKNLRIVYISVKPLPNRKQK